MAHNHSIRNILEIKDQNILFENKTTEEIHNNLKSVVFYGTLTYTPSGCTNCGVINQSHADIVKNGTKISTIKLGQFNYKPVLLKLKKQRFFCKHCHSTFSAQTSLVDRNCFISNPLKALIVLELVEEQSMTLIAKHLNVSVSTVLRQLVQAGESLRPSEDYLPTHLGFDEFKSVKEVSGAMSFIFIDNVTHEVIDIIENRQQRYLLDYFMRFSYEARKKVQTVTIDMYSPYIGVIKGCFPNAKIIIDRFHIVQHLNRCLNQMRIKTMNDLRSVQPRDYRKLKRQWKLVLKNSTDLNFNDFFTHRLYDGMVSENIMANYLVGLSPQLSDTYELVNNLKSAIKYHDFKRFKQLLLDTKKRTYPRKVRTVLQTLEKYLDSIEESLTYTLSNGPIEGINNKIKNIKRSGYGYRNFRNLRSRALIVFSLVKKKAEPKELYYELKKVR